MLILAGRLQAQSEEVRRLTQNPLTTQASMRLLHLTKSGDRATKLFLLDTWGEIGPNAALHWYRIYKVRDWSTRRLKFPGLLARAIYDIAIGPDPELALAAARTLAKLHRPYRPLAEGEEPRCGVISRPGGIPAGIYLEQMGGKYRDRLLNVAVDPDVRVFEGIVQPLFRYEPKAAIAQLESRLAVAQPEDRKWLTHRYAGFLRDTKNLPKLRNLAESLGSDHSGTFLLLTTAESITAYGRDLIKWPPVLKWALLRDYEPPPDIINQLLSDTDPALKARAVLRWRPAFTADLAIQRELAKIDLKSPLTKCFYPDPCRLGSYSHVVGLGEAASPMFLSMVIAEAKTPGEFEFAISRLGKRAIEEANGAEALALYNHWPSSRTHLEQMLGGERYVSRYVAAYVLLQLPDDKFSRNQKRELIHRIALDKNPIVPNVLLEGYQLPPADLCQETLIEIANRRDTTEFVLDVLDRIRSSVQEWSQLLNVCSNHSHPQIREYALELQKQKYR